MGMQTLWKFYKICLWEPEEIRSRVLEYLSLQQFVSVLVRVLQGGSFDVLKEKNR